MDVLPLIQIRPMVENDLDAVMAIEIASYPKPWTCQHFRDEIAARYAWPFVGTVEGSVVGYVCLMSLFEEAQIQNIAVSPSQRGKGIACVLLEHAFRLAREQAAEIMALEVRASNRAAITLYEKYGFARVGIRSRYYEATEDAVLMEKLLKESP